MTKETSDAIVDAISQLATEVHELAKSKGWHEQDQSDDNAFITRTVANLHGEVSELWEAYRNHRFHKACDKADEMMAQRCVILTSAEEEMADILIRLLDSAKRLNIDIGAAVMAKHAFNKTRPMRHGGKKA